MQSWEEMTMSDTGRTYSPVDERRYTIPAEPGLWSTILYQLRDDSDEVGTDRALIIAWNIHTFSYETPFDPHHEVTPVFAGEWNTVETEFAVLLPSPDGKWHDVTHSLPTLYIVEGYTLDDVEAEFAESLREYRREKSAPGPGSDQAMYDQALYERRAEVRKRTRQRSRLRVVKTDE
jgi:hypothetical protein